MRISLTGTTTFTSNASTAPLIAIIGASEVARIDSSGRLGLGSSSPDALLTVNGIGAFGAGAVTTPSIAATGDLNTGFWFPAADTIAASTGGSERARIDSSGRLLVGTSSAYSSPLWQGGPSLQYEAGFQVAGTSLDTGAAHISCWSNTASAPAGLMLTKSNGGLGSYGTALATDNYIGQIIFAGSDGSKFVQGAIIQAQVDGTSGSNDLPTRLMFSTTADGASSPTERMRITNGGSVFVGKTSGAGQGNVLGIDLGTNQGQALFVTGSTNILYLNRNTDDGDLIRFAQGGNDEGTISVSGTTVSYNGAHLSRWSQLPGGAEREEILRGTVLSNIDEMCAWGEEDNEQLNRMKVSDAEGDPNVSGVFQAWDDDDDTYTDDFYCAMTGDFIIRIAESVTVQRGDLLMSAGDGTAKPQDDDIIRSKTIAKVTSTHVTCTYDDGSYCVPCVLMAC
jgi:hypothetical protein